MKTFFKLSDEAACTYGILEPGPDAVPPMKGKSGPNWHCPECSIVLAERMTLDNLKLFVNGAIKCNECGTISTWALKH